MVLLRSSEQLDSVTVDDLAILSNPRRSAPGQAGYAGVSRHDRRWRARVYVAASIAGADGRNKIHSQDRHYITLGVFEQESDAARAVVRWYKTHFGAVWPFVFRYRRCRVWEAVRCDDGRGYTAWVWWKGVPVLVTLADIKAKPKNGDRRRWVWPSRCCARQAVRLWVVRRVGGTSPEHMLSLYRLGPSRRPWKFSGFVAQIDDGRYVAAELGEPSPTASVTVVA